MEQLIEETKNTYYGYVIHISKGSKEIAHQLRTGNLEEAYKHIIKFAEGMDWLVKVEDLMLKNKYKINSRIAEVSKFLLQINEALENKDYILVADLFEYEISTIFQSASEWIFEGEN